MATETIPPPGGALCSTCGAPLSDVGDCLACLLRPGLDDTLAEASPPPPSTFATVYGDFEVARREDGSLWELGRGAMGVTYRAVDRVLHRPVALKVIQLGPAGTHDSRKSDRLRERFLREARAAAALRHANVAGIYHFGASEQADRCFYAMELIEGETLEARVRRDGPLDVSSALEVAHQVCAALVAAADRGLIHRDLKPGNLMLTGGSGKSPAGLEVKVIDFGLAKAAANIGEADLTHGGFVGTPAFASPEQFGRGAAVDARSDLYSLGITLWYALTGKVPFVGRSLEELRDDPRRAHPPVEQLVHQGVPACVVALVGRVLAVDPAGRPASAKELLKALENCRERPVAAPAPPVAQLRLAVGIVAIMGLAAAASAGAWWWTWTHAPAVPMQRAVGATPPAAEKSIAVLPFENLSSDKDNAYFTDGVQDEILTDLAKVADLKVIARSSVMQYKSDTPRNLREIAAQLGVAHVLEGSVQRAGNQVRVTAQLIDARTETHQWADHYDRPLDNVFAIQSEIAQAIAGQLQAQLSPREKSAIDAPPTNDLQAFDLYLRAQDLFRSLGDILQGAGKLPEAILTLKEALARDPKFLKAWCLLACIHGDLYWQGADHTPARLEQYNAAVQAAVRLQPEAGETHLALADYYYHGYRDYDRATAELELARHTLPNAAPIYEYTGYILRRQGRWAESMRNLKQALALDPRNAELLVQTGDSFQEMHQYADAERTYQRAVDIRPLDPSARLNLAQLALYARADIKPFQTLLPELLAEDPSVAPDVDDPVAALCERTPAAAARTLSHMRPDGVPSYGVVIPRAYWEGVVARCEGDAPRARTAFTAARPEVAKMVAAQPNVGIFSSLLGLIDAGLGHKEEAIREGRRGCELLPISKDAVDGAIIAADLAQIYAWTGEKAAAVGQLSVVESVPNDLPYGLLKLDPEWDDLRGDKGFEALVASLAPK